MAWGDSSTRSSAPVDDRRPEPEEQHRELLAHVPRQHDDGIRRHGLVDGGPGQADAHLGGQAVAQLGVDRVGAEDPLGQLGPGVGPLVGESGPADDADGLRSALGRSRLEAVGHRGQRLVPGHRHQVTSLADHGVGQALLGVDRVEGEAALVAQPSVIDRIGIDAEQPGHPVGRGLDGDPASHRAGGAGRLDLVEVPGAGGEPVGRGGEGAHRADLHGVAREVGGEGQLGEGVDLELLAPADEVDLGLAGHLVGEAGAPAALDAALAVEQDQLGDGDGLLEVALLLDEPRLPGAVGQGLVLQGALATLVAHRAVERVVDEQELEHAVLGLLDLVGVGHHRRALLHLDVAAGLQRRSPGPADLDQAHPAHPDRLHPRVVTEPGDEGPRPLGRGDEHLALPPTDLPAVEGERHRVDGHVEGHVGGLGGHRVVGGGGGHGGVPLRGEGLLTHRGSLPP